MRPRTLDEYIGQQHIVGPGRLLRRAIEADRLGSLLFPGPPGTGKTTLARVIAGTTKAYFSGLNAVLAGVKDIRLAVSEAAERRDLRGQRTLCLSMRCIASTRRSRMRSCPGSKTVRSC